MAKSNGQALPILIAGGGIGGLAAAHALARKGFAVRVLEHAAEFREIGAGIQLGPNVFRALERLGLKEAVLDAVDAEVGALIDGAVADSASAGHGDAVRAHWQARDPHSAR